MVNIGDIGEQNTEHMQIILTPQDHTGTDHTEHTSSYRVRIGYRHILTMIQLYQNARVISKITITIIK